MARKSIFRILLVTILLVFLIRMTAMSIGAQEGNQTVFPDYKVNDISISGDGNRIAVTQKGIQQGDVRISIIDVFEFPSLTRVYSLQLVVASIDLISLSYNGRKLAYSLTYNDLVVVNLDTEEAEYLLQGTTGYGVAVLSWQPYGDILLWSAGAGAVCVKGFETTSVKRLRQIRQ